MIYIDKYAYFSGFRNISGDFKILWGLCALFATISVRSIWAHLFVLLLMSLLLVTKGEIPWRYYLRLLALPMLFLFFSTLSIILNIGEYGHGFILGYSETFGLSAYITQKGLWFALELGIKSMSAVTCMYFIILTTPIADFITFLRKCRAPKAFLFMMMMIYRFIFLLLEIGSTKVQSQRCRYGYNNMKNSIRSLKMLWGTTLIQSLRASDWHYKSMLARGYNGEIRSLATNFDWKVWEVLSIFFLVTLILVINYYG